VVRLLFYKDNNFILAVISFENWTTASVQYRFTFESKCSSTFFVSNFVLNIVENFTIFVNFSKIMEFKIIKSKRVCRMAVYKNFKYNFGSTSKKYGSSRWRCDIRTCSALIYSDKNDFFLSTTGEHNHISYDLTNIHR
jgi:hypothetical protein